MPFEGSPPRPVDIFRQAAIPPEVFINGFEFDIILHQSLMNFIVQRDAMLWQKLRQVIQKDFCAEDTGIAPQVIVILGFRRKGSVEFMSHDQNCGGIETGLPSFLSTALPDVLTVVFA